MSWRISRKTICVLIGIFIFAVLATIGGMRVYFHWTNSQYFGEIIDTKNGDFVIKADKDSEMFVLTNQYTDIRRGRKIWTGRLQIGDFVMVVGSPNQEGLIEAKVIRIISPSPLKPPLRK